MEWIQTNIGQLGKIITGKTPKTSIVENYGGSIPFLSPSDDMSFKSAPKTARTLTEIGLSEVKNCLVPANSICVSCIGSDLGKVVKTNMPMVTNQQINTIVPNNDNDADFIYYLMLIVGKELNYISKTSTAVPIINKSTFSDWSITIPKDIDDQRRIASILSSLDKKIETNNKINANLEEMAQAIFKNWFVDFAPFKDGKFVESELGMIPEGWRVGTLSEVADIKKKSITPNKTPDSYFNHYSLPAFDVNKLPVYQLGSEIMSSKFIFWSRTTLISKLNPHIKRIWFVDDVMENGICSTEFIPIKAKDEEIAAYIHFLICSNIFYNTICSSVNGATNSHQRINPEDILEYKIALNEETISRYSKFAYPILKKISKNITENARLASLRDTLLPRLMSGEIEV